MTARTYQKAYSAFVIMSMTVAILSTSKMITAPSKPFMVFRMTGPRFKMSERLLRGSASLFALRRTKTKRRFSPQEGRLLTFPNTMQHRVYPFHLEDPTKPGHRRILALFLVDPHQRIISTANVPCQQKEWWQHQINDIGPLGGIPLELIQQINLKTEGFPVSLEVAKEQRLELMEERKNFGEDHQQVFDDLSSFSLCEH